MTDYDDLRAKAMAATPGPWTYEEEDYAPERVRFPNGQHATVNGDSAETCATAAYIAAANPTVILALLDENARLREAGRIMSERNSSLDIECNRLAIENARLRESAEQAEANARAARDALEYNLGIANHTTREAQAERNSIIRRLRSHYSAIQVAGMVGLTRQRVHQILNEPTAIARAALAPEKGKG